MTETTAALIAFVALLVFLLILAGIWRIVSPSSTSRVENARHAFELFRRAKDIPSKLFVLFVLSPYLLTRGLGTVLIAIGGGGFACIALFFGIDLKELRKALLDFYDFVANLVGSKSPVVGAVR
ncbi:MAG: hypothetical protein GKR94_28720 [Gammaproteobacteria bacterium]|nr:hypothetical protein [Gammaproteobacteria bacterium]